MRKGILWGTGIIIIGWFTSVFNAITEHAWIMGVVLLSVFVFWMFLKNKSKNKNLEVWQ